MGGVDRIAAERQRQIDDEGWTPEHDDEHVNCELAVAAGVYAMPYNGSWKTETWPWDLSTFRYAPMTTEGRIRDLVRAGALIAAEIDRLERAK